MSKLTFCVPVNFGFLICLTLGSAQAAVSSAMPRGQLRSSDRAYPTKVWCLHSGKTLKQSLLIWAKRAGWQLQWPFHHDYPIVVTTCFRGDFFQTIQSVAHAYGKAERPFYLDLYPRQRLAIISD